MAIGPTQPDSSGRRQPTPAATPDDSGAFSAQFAASTRRVNIQPAPINVLTPEVIVGNTGRNPGGEVQLNLGGQTVTAQGGGANTAQGTDFEVTTPGAISNGDASSTAGGGTVSNPPKVIAAQSASSWKDSIPEVVLSNPVAPGTVFGGGPGSAGGGPTGTTNMRPAGASRDPNSTQAVSVDGALINFPPLNESARNPAAPRIIFGSGWIPAGDGKTYTTSSGAKAVVGVHPRLSVPSGAEFKRVRTEHGPGKKFRNGYIVGITREGKPYAMNPKGEFKLLKPGVQKIGGFKVRAFMASTVNVNYPDGRFLRYDSRGNVRGTDKATRTAAATGGGSGSPAAPVPDSSSGSDAPKEPASGSSSGGGAGGIGGILSQLTGSIGSLEGIIGSLGGLMGGLGSTTGGGGGDGAAAGSDLLGGLGSLLGGGGGGIGSIFGSLLGGLGGGLSGGGGISPEFAESMRGILGRVEDLLDANS